MRERIFFPSPSKAITLIISPVSADWRWRLCSGLHNRQRQSADTGEMIKVIAFEGDGKKIRSRITVRAHPKPVPGCLACAKGECYRRAVAFEGGPEGQEIPKFPRPREIFHGMV